MKTRALTFLGSVILTSNLAFAGPREDAIDKAYDLATTSADLSDYLRHSCGCPNSSSYLAKLSDQSVEMEIILRNESRNAAIAHLKKLVRTAIEMRKFVNNIPSASIRLKVKRGYLYTLNDLGTIVDPKFVVVKAYVTGEENMLDAIATGLDANLTTGSEHQAVVEF